MAVVEILESLSLEYYVVILMWLNVVAWAEKEERVNNKLRPYMFWGMVLSFLCVFLKLLVKITSILQNEGAYDSYLLKINNGLVLVHLAVFVLFCYCFYVLLTLKQSKKKK